MDDFVLRYIEQVQQRSGMWVSHKEVLRWLDLGRRFLNGEFSKTTLTYEMLVRAGWTDDMDPRALRDSFEFAIALLKDDG